MQSTFVFQFYSAVSTDLPADVTFGVTGEYLTLTCTTTEAGLTTFAFYNAADEEQQGFSTGNTYDTFTAGSYYCIAANADQTERTAATAQVNVAFKSKSFHIHHLFDK